MKGANHRQFRMALQKKGISWPGIPPGIPSTPNPVNNTFEKVSLGAPKTPHSFKGGKQHI